MPLDGSYGRLNAYKHRTADMKRRKESNKELAKIFSERDERLYDFKKVSPDELEVIKENIRIKARLKKRNTILIIVIPMIIGLVCFVYLLKKLNIY